MLVVLAYHPGDLQLAESLLAWIGELDGKLANHELLLVASSGVAKEDWMSMFHLGQQVFGKAHSIHQREVEEGPWPGPANAIFRLATTWLDSNVRQPFLWLESDCVPLKSGWLTAIEREYLGSKRVFMGAMYEHPYPHINGCAVYGRGFAVAAPMLRSVNSRLPFDLADAKRVMAAAHKTNLIQRSLPHPPARGGWHFDDFQTVERVVDKEAVLFHGCKDGSLIEHLRGVYGGRYGFSCNWTARQNRVCVVQLGRNGDLIDLLPVLLLIHNTYGKPVVMVQRQFAGLLEGVSYADAYPVDVGHADLDQALTLARQQFRYVLHTQVWSSTWEAEHRTPSYNMEQWRMAGFLSRFKDGMLRPVFDRDTERQTANGGKPFLMVSLAGGLSSPMPNGEALTKEIGVEWAGTFGVLDVAAYKAKRIYDMLGLLNAAHCLVSNDSVLLHLAAASDVPVVALVNPRPWRGTVLRYKPVARISYNEVTTQALNRAIKSTMPKLMRASHRRHLGRCIMPEAAPERRIFHAVERHDERDHGEQERKSRAQRSWDGLYEQGVIPVHLWRYPRTAKAIGDKRDLPYLKDVLGAAMAKASPQDIILWTNDDSWLHPRLPDVVRLFASLYGAVTSQRCDSRLPMPEAGQCLTPEQYARLRGRHMGRDLFAFTKYWLKEHWNQIGDYILGASDFDLAMATLIRHTHGIETTRPNLEECIHPAELPRGYVCHEVHAAAWCQKGNEDEAPSQKHNRALFRKWARKHAPNMKFDELNRVAE